MRRDLPIVAKYLLVVAVAFALAYVIAQSDVAPRDREIQANVKAATLAFWNATLKNDESARRSLDSGFKSVLDVKDFHASK